MDRAEALRELHSWKLRLLNMAGFQVGWFAYVLGIVLGAAGGPAAYYAGVRLGAIEFQASLTISFLSLALVWAAALPLLLCWARKDHS